MKNKIRKYFTQVPNELINDKSISRDARFLFVYFCSKPDDWEYHNSVIEKDLNCGKDSRIKYTKELIEKGWISLTQKKNENGEFGSNDIELNPYPIFSDTVKIPIPKKPDTEKNGGGKTPTLNNKDNLTNNNLFTNTEEVVDLPTQILNYLNEKKPSKIPFKPTPQNLKDIKIRIKEKYSFDDFKKVIDFKVNQWANDKKMKQYIRPETLFGGKFDGYLVQAMEGNLNNDGSENFELNQTEKADLI